MKNLDLVQNTVANWDTVCLLRKKIYLGGAVEPVVISYR